jgi:hypothetical protein
MQKWFTCEYQMKSRNVTLYFEARSPAKAEEILGYFVNDLREKLKTRELQDVSTAIDSLKAEVPLSSDAPLQDQLYELIAKQVEQVKLAQVQADFAFTVTEPPATPDMIYSPNVLIDTEIVGISTLLLSSSLLILRRTVAPTDLEQPSARQGYSIETALTRGL